MIETGTAVRAEIRIYIWDMAWDITLYIWDETMGCKAGHKLQLDGMLSIIVW